MYQNSRLRDKGKEGDLLNPRAINRVGIEATFKQAGRLKSIYRIDRVRENGQRGIFAEQHDTNNGMRGIAEIVTRGVPIRSRTCRLLIDTQTSTRAPPRNFLFWRTREQLSYENVNMQRRK